MKSFSKCAAVLAGGLVFAGYATGATISENFESATQTGGGAAGNLGGGTGGEWGAYGTAQNYSGDDHTAALGGAGGSFYGHTIGVDPNPVSDAVAIDAGHNAIEVEAWLANYTADSDNTVIGIVQYSDAGVTVVSDDDVLTGTQDAWEFQTGSVAVAAGATHFAVRFGGVGNDTYADNIVATSVVPEPGSLALLGLGGLAMLRRRRG
ncbi:MAG: PEP-CTERM sorting domain-containing protein [Planctomycetota bacterium]